MQPSLRGLRLALVLLLVAGPLTGCASLSERACLHGDWYDIGVRDGANGAGEERLLEHAKACGRHGVRPDRIRWAEGREAGLERYCTVHRGLAVGEHGGRYGGVCRGLGEEEFLAGYGVGRDLARVRHRLGEVAGEIRSLEAALDDDAVEKDRNERRRLRARLVQFEIERFALEREREELEYRAARL